MTLKQRRKQVDQQQFKALCVSIGIGAAFGAVIEGGMYAWEHRDDGFTWTGLAKASAKGALTGAVAGALMPGTGNLAARGLGLTGGRALGTSAAVNAGVGAGFSWGVNQVQCRPTGPGDLLLGAAGGGASSLIGPAISYFKGRLFAPRTTVYAHTPASAGNGIIGTHQPLQQNAVSIGARDLGDGFSGIYSPSTGKLEARLSGEFEGALVKRNGGHRVINRESFGLADDTVAFTAIIREEGLEVTWLSRGVNGWKYGQLEAPIEYRQPIIDLLESVTGLMVWG